MSPLQDRKTTGIVFNIQKYSVHDGPGIRTIVFLKGCPMACAWCSNPESQHRMPELAYNPSKCMGFEECFRCVEVCTVGAITRNEEDDTVSLDRELCNGCFACASVCPSHALNLYGYEMSVDEALKKVEQDEMFYARSQGGMTLSGGEPLLQADFALALLREAKRRRINTAIETCGYCKWDVMEVACRHLDTLLMDIKCIDPDKHRKHIKASNQRILDNFARCCQMFPDLPKLIRTPIIPGFNDSEEDIEAILDVVADKPNVSYELLAYHRMAEPKYAYLGRQYPLKGRALAKGLMERLNALVHNRMPPRQQPGRENEQRVAG